MATTRCQRVQLSLLLAMCLVSCGGGGGGGVGTSGSPTDNPSTPDPTVTNACVAPEFSVQLADAIALEPAFPELPAISRLVGLYQQPGDDSRWYALSQRGRVLQFDNTPDASEFSEFLNIEARTDSSAREAGFLGFAFHPDFPRTDFAFAYYMPSVDQARLSRFQLRADGTALDPDSEVILLEIDQPATNHNGGGLGFGPDGYLYLSLGDGGGGGDPFDQGQDTNTLLAAMLRLDIDASEGGRNYAIPDDNPFADGGGRAEVYAYGLRNPWRWSFDRLNGDLWLGDVGQGETEEIDRIVPGGNYGWPIMEGSNCYNATQCDRSGLSLPAFEYTHTESGGCSVTGGYVYRGADDSLAGTYFFGDFCTGVIYGGSSQQPSEYRQMLDSPLSLSAFAEDQAGELYALDIGGGAGRGIYRLVAAQSDGVPAEMPELLSETGCFTDTASREVAPAVTSYSLIAPFWSDGANKARYFSLPDESAIAINDDGEFQFPDRSVLIKHFYHLDEILETRLLMKHSDGWAGYSYQWNDDKTDASLLEAREYVAIDDDYSHFYPSRGDCLECHTAAAGWALGAETLQLNRDNQLAELEDDGYFSSPVPEPLMAQSLSAPDDEQASLEQRARSYLHANCAYCHRPGGPIETMDLRYSVPLSAMNVCDVAPDYGGLWASNPRLLAPGDAGNSLLALRLVVGGSNRMPPLATFEVDQDGVDLVRAWIDSLENCAD